MVIRKGSFGEEIGTPTQPGKEITIDNDAIANKVLRPKQNLPAPGWDWKEMSLLKKALVAAVFAAAIVMFVLFSLPASTRESLINPQPGSQAPPGSQPPAGNQPVVGAVTPTQIGKETKSTTTASVYMTEFKQTTGRDLNINPETMLELNRNKYDTSIRLPRFAIATTIQYTDLYVSNLNLDTQSSKITGEIENRGNKPETAGITLLVFTNDHKTSDFTANFITVVGNRFEQLSGASFPIKPGEKVKFEISQKTLTPNQYAVFKEYLPKAQYGVLATFLK